ncbi:HD domain-containing phosphohydrolase [Paenibacillus filicis]|uniref:HD domain-containing phosphohydrolase n=1 Tax=Paenibacillus filicis TaxID=669464 RepID=A0ABU9DN52_9BACL
MAIGSLLHDMGLAYSAADSLLIQHPVTGYELLQAVPGISEGALNIVLQHHEQLDGRGFPQGITGKELSEGAQICGICSDCAFLKAFVPYPLGTVYKEMGDRYAYYFSQA